MRGIIMVADTAKFSDAASSPVFVPARRPPARQARLRMCSDGIGHDKFLELVEQRLSHAFTPRVHQRTPLSRRHSVSTACRPISACTSRNRKGSTGSVCPCRSASSPASRCAGWPGSRKIWATAISA